jgi:uncharacterized membrane protein SpoIIM required for sporulation
MLSLTARPVLLPASTAAAAAAAAGMPWSWDVLRRDRQQESSRTMEVKMYMAGSGALLMSKLLLMLLLLLLLPPS